MTFMVLTSEYLSLNGTDLTAFTSKCEVGVDVEEKDITTFASAGWKAVIGGLKSGSLSIDFKQDFGVSGLDAILWPLLGQVVPFEVRPTSAAASVSNPKFTGSVLIKEYKPIQGGVGDEAALSVSYSTSGAVTRATS